MEKTESNPTYKATEYADYRCFTSVITPYTDQGWTATPTADFSTPTMDFVDWDATISKNDELRYIVELKSRSEDYTSTMYDDFIIDASKINRLTKGMEANGVDAYIFELFPSEGVGYVWHISPLSTFTTRWVNANANTLKGDRKKRKKMVVLPHCQATTVTFPTDLWGESFKKAIEYYNKINKQ